MCFQLCCYHISKISHLKSHMSDSASVYPLSIISNHPYKRDKRSQRNNQTHKWKTTVAKTKRGPQFTKPNIEKTEQNKPHQKPGLVLLHMWHPIVLLICVQPNDMSKLHVVGHIL